MSTKNENSGALGFLYGNFCGRCILRLLRAKWLSKTAGAFLNTRLSKPLIKPFVENNNINLDDYISDNFNCFNDCFSRQIKDGKRVVDENPFALIAPCDGLLSVYKIEDGTVMDIKHGKYTVSTLLKSENTAKNFLGGYAFVFRLCVNHYHRYCYPANGQKGKNVYINGTLHTVRPVALEKYRVFCENSREYTLIDTDNFGRLLQMEVGAMFVGKIKNYHGEKAVEKGEEKGMFLYGGSTVVLLTESGRVTPKEIFLSATEKGEETPVKLGEQINI